MQLLEASIVNGCQTTMSIVNYHKENFDNQGFVLVKIVQTENSWDVARSANFQNEINKIDLDLAQYISPQKVRLAADESGYKLTHKLESPFALLDRIYTQRVSYDSIRTLFTGFFSNNPMNVLQIVHSEMKQSLLKGFFEDNDKNRIYHILFKISEKAEIETTKINDALELKNELALRAMFQRFLKQESTRYRTLLTILSCCACYGENIYEDAYGLNYAKMISFMNTIEQETSSTDSRFGIFFLMLLKLLQIML